MISEELLNAVYPIDVNSECYVGIQESTGRVMWFGKEHNDCRSEIDIYRVAHKCKEWAYKEGFIIDTGFHKYHINQFKANCYGWVSSNINIKQHFSECAEHKAIFKACQWVLDNKDNK